MEINLKKLKPYIKKFMKYEINNCSECFFNNEIECILFDKVISKPNDRLKICQEIFIKLCLEAGDYQQFIKLMRLFRLNLTENIKDYI